MRNKTNISVRNNQGVPINVHMILDTNGSYASGDILDANATEKVVDRRIASVVDAAPEALDTLKEIGAAIPTKLSQLTNDVGFITENDGLKSFVPQGSLATVATSGSYNDLTGKPGLAAVALTGSYGDLENTPTIPAAQIQSDWNQTNTSAKDYIQNKPNLASVATSGSYNDLTNTPTIPAAQVNADWNAVSGVAQILNKPTIPDISGKIDKVSGATNGNFASLTSDGNLADSGKKANDFVSKTEFETKIQQLNEGVRWYGIKWTSENATPERIGSKELHMTLPIQSKMRRCMLQDNGTVTGYISDSDYTKYTNGTTVDYTGGDGQFMVEIPEYYYDAFTYTENGVTTNYLMLYPTAKVGKKSKKVYVSAVEACSNDADTDQATKKLFSICMADGTVTSGSMAASSITYDANAAKYRGGSSPTTSTNDANVNSELGRPVTNKTRASFRTYAANRGTGWSQQYWSAYMSFVRLYVVEYCNFNTLATYNSSLTAEGFKQGGLGEGFSNIDSTFWSNYNGYQPIAPCGVTKSLVNNTGIVSLSFAADEMGSGVSAISFQIPSYRGIENPFGHIWKWTDGINVNTVSDITSVYTCENITNFADDTTSNYNMRAQFDKPSDGWIKTWNWDENGDFIPTSTGGSSASYLCDYSWWSNGWRVVRSSGSASNGSHCGLFCFGAGSGSSGASALFGGRLYYTPAE